MLDRLRRQWQRANPRFYGAIVCNWDDAAVPARFAHFGDRAGGEAWVARRNAENPFRDLESGIRFELRPLPDPSVWVRIWRVSSFAAWLATPLLLAVLVIGAAFGRVPLWAVGTAAGGYVATVTMRAYDDAKRRRQWPQTAWPPVE